jgi:hypothetical protein
MACSEIRNPGPTPAPHLPTHPLHAANPPRAQPPRNLPALGRTFGPPQPRRGALPLLATPGRAPPGLRHPPGRAPPRRPAAGQGGEGGAQGGSRGRGRGEGEEAAAGGAWGWALRGSSCLAGPSGRRERSGRLRAAGEGGSGRLRAAGEGGRSEPRRAPRRAPPPPPPPATVPSPLSLPPRNPPRHTLPRPARRPPYPSRRTGRARPKASPSAPPGRAPAAPTAPPGERAGRGAGGGAGRRAARQEGEALGEAGGKGLPPCPDAERWGGPRRGRDAAPAGPCPVSRGGGEAPARPGQGKAGAKQGEAKQGGCDRAKRGGEGGEQTSRAKEIKPERQAVPRPQLPSPCFSCAFPFPTFSSPPLRLEARSTPDKQVGIHVSQFTLSCRYCFL